MHNSILQLRSHYSVSEGLNKIPDVLQYSKNHGIDSVALNDLDNMYGWIKFYQKARAMGIKPIASVSILMGIDDHIIGCSLYCQNNAGYQSLISILSQGYEHKTRVGVRPLIDGHKVLSAEGLFVVIDPLVGDINQYLKAKKNSEIETLLQFFQPLIRQKRVFGALPIITRENETELNYDFATVCHVLNIPLLAMYPVCFPSQDDYTAHDVKVCVYQGRVVHDTTREVVHTDQQYLKTSDVMAALYRDVPQAIMNANHFAMMCNVELDMTQILLPDVSASGDANSDFRIAAYQGFKNRALELGLSKEDKVRYQERLDIEILTICQMGFASYFMIVADFIQWAKNNQVPVGPGRGSGAGSLAAYVLLITDVDPLAYDLLFERFLNPERVSMPDFDIDFCMVGRDRVIQYVAEKYGRDHVSQIITFGTMAAKAVIRDVGRAQGHPYGFTDKLAKLIPFDLGITLDQALSQEPILQSRYQTEPDVSNIINLSKKLEGLVRNVGTHAGGVVIAPSPLHEIAPIYVDTQHSGLVTQFDKDDVEKIGLVKFDFLGLRTLTIIDWAIKNIHTSEDVEIDIAKIDLADTKTFDLLKASNTTGVFQLESQGMKDLIDRLAPDYIEDIIALVALYRPGPLQSGMVDDFVKRKHGLEPVTYLHDSLEEILKNTYGVILYQEQVMQIAQSMANYSLGGADLLRRAMGKKKPEEMEKQRIIFQEGAQENQIDASIASEIFDLMEKFAGYGFNKSHSAAYGLISYQTAWLKANYPTAFMASVLSSDMDNTDKLLIFLSDAKDNGIKILPPCINDSLQYFKVTGELEVRYGLGSIKGVGSLIAKEISSNGPYQSLYSLFIRIPKLSRRVAEALIKSGACDLWQQSRSVLLASIDAALKTSAKERLNQQQGQVDLFGSASTVDFRYTQASEKSLMQTLKDEYESLGYYLSAHPVDACKNELEHLSTKRIQTLSVTQNTVRIAGVLSKLKTVKTKKGSRIAFGEIGDDSAQIDIAVFDEVYQSSYEALSYSGILICEGSISIDSHTKNLRMQCSRIKTLDEIRQEQSPAVMIHLKNFNIKLLDELDQLLRMHKGGSSVYLQYYAQKGIARMKLPLTVGVNEDWLSALTVFSGIDNVVLKY
ncbi:DNA polymerase III subunit alpha [Gammaproteobacteria bacterium]|nr:DNA polymerase III subunit alpha [Gammaproteobacteria bacterium]